ncbi:helix-turn-helix domain-containing protein [Pandoraea pnomenusa]|uniref:helix-turn-helix domain-containing protein n=1 Tax=Pandoraea pnomenusa TaxID=93220 RepID=UPI00124181CE|nr:helix-turn-helix transcriptional regulator [Pandoraea pnomenusa]
MQPDQVADEIATVDLDDLLAEFETNYGESVTKQAHAWVGNALYGDEAPTIASLRLKHGLSQKKLAERMGVKQPRIAEIELGSGSIKFDTLQKLAAALDTDVGEIAAAYENTLAQKRA